MLSVTCSAHSFRSFTGKSFEFINLLSIYLLIHIFSILLKNVDVTVFREDQLDALLSEREEVAVKRQRSRELFHLLQQAVHVSRSCFYKYLQNPIFSMPMSSIRNF